MTDNSTPPNRHEQRRLRTRRKLLDAAKRVFSEQGFHDATVLDISNMADVSKRTLYVHFENGKEQILEELARQSVDEVIALINAAEADAPELPMRQSMQASHEIVFQWMQENPCLAAIIFGPEANPTLRAKIIDYVAEQIVVVMCKETTFRDDAPVPMHIVAQMEAAALAQLVLWSLTNEHDYTPADFARFVVAVFFGSVVDLYPDEYQDQVG